MTVLTGNEVVIPKDHAAAILQFLSRVPIQGSEALALVEIGSNIEDQLQELDTPAAPITED